MKKNTSVFRTNVIYGLLVLVPLAVIVLLLAKIGSKKILGSIKL